MNVEISKMSWDEYEERVKNSIVFIPIGATEQHGYHLPLGTDFYQINKLTCLVAKEVNGIVAPAIPYGYKSQAKSGGGQIFPGTTSLNGITLIMLMKDILLELIRHGATKLVIMDGHMENELFLSESVDLALKEANKTDIKILKCGLADLIDEETIENVFPDKFPGWSIEHAAFMETSLMSYLYPELVKADKAVTENAILPKYDIYPQPKDLVPKSGVLWDPANGNKAGGEIFAKNIIKNCINMVKTEF
jgi:creatinine amidohydrolase